MLKKSAIYTSSALQCLIFLYCVQYVSTKLGYGLTPGKVTSHYLNNNDNPIQWHINASSHLSELSIKAHYRPYLVRRHIRVCAVWIINQKALNNHDVIAIPTRWSHNLNGQGQLATDSLISTRGRCELNISIGNMKSPNIVFPMISICGLYSNCGMLWSTPVCNLCTYICGVGWGAHPWLLFRNMWVAKLPATPDNGRLQADNAAI